MKSLTEERKTALYRLVDEAAKRGTGGNLINAIDELLFEVDWLRARVAALTADTQRLDWLEDPQHRITPRRRQNDGPMEFVAGFFRRHGGCTDRHFVARSTVRAAIDAALCLEEGRAE